MINGLSGQRMLLALAIGIILLIIMVLKTKIQAFLALITTTVLVGVIGGMPLLNITLEDGKTFGIINSITSGFGGTLGSIGIIIGFGVMMGQIFEVTGAAKRMAYTFLKLFGKGREEEALAFTGFLVSIPIFCGRPRSLSSLWASPWQQVLSSPTPWFRPLPAPWASAVSSESMSVSSSFSRSFWHCPWPSPASSMHALSLPRSITGFWMTTMSLTLLLTRNPIMTALSAWI